MKIKKVKIIELGFWTKAKQIEAYTLADYFSFTDKIDIWL